MKRLGFVGCGLWAILVVGCGAAEGADPEGAFDAEAVGESTQGLNKWSVSLEQGKPVTLCGPNPDLPCSTLSPSYAGTQDLTVRVGITAKFENGSESEASSAESSYVVSLIKWDISALSRGRLPPGFKLASARVSLKINSTSPTDFPVVPVANVWSEDQPRWNPRANLQASSDPIGLLVPRNVGRKGSLQPVVSFDLELAQFEPLFRVWLADSTKNQGLWIGIAGTPVEPVQPTTWQSSEAASPPRLTLTFTTP